MHKKWLAKILIRFSTPYVERTESLKRQTTSETCPLAPDYHVDRINPLFIECTPLDLSIDKLEDSTMKGGNVYCQPKLLGLLSPSFPLEKSVNLSCIALNIGDTSHWKSDLITVNKNPSISRSSHRAKLWVCCDSRYVTNITITGVEVIMVPALKECHYDGNQSLGSSLQFSDDDDNNDESTGFSEEESEGLSSLAIDEDLFRSSHGEPLEVVISSYNAIPGTSEMTPSNGPSWNQPTDANDSVKGLYEILSNSRERQIITQALRGTRQEPLLKKWMETSYGTTSFGRVSDIVYSSPLPALPERSPYPQMQHLRVHDFMKDSNVKSSVNQHGTSHTPIIHSINSSKEPDVTLQGASRVKRHPPMEAMREELCPRLAICLNATQKYFRHHRNRDAIKIIVTTLLGLIAFGVITALSLSVTRL